MNQILSTEDVNKKTTKSKTKDIKSIIKFFAIALVLFGVFLIASSSFALFKDNKTSSQKKEAPKANISTQTTEEDQVLVSITSPEKIGTISYYWDNKDKEKISGDSRTFTQLKLDIPDGTNTLNITVTDVNGNETNYNEEFTLENNIQIELEQSGNNIKINVSAKDYLKEIKYTLDDKEKIVQVEDNKNNYSFEIDVSAGEHDLVIVATDVNDNKKDKSKTIIGKKKPTVKIEMGEDCYIISAYDDEGLDRIEIETIANGEVIPIKIDGGKEFTTEYPLKEGDNYIRVKAYNSSGVASKGKKVKCQK